MLDSLQDLLNTIHIFMPKQIIAAGGLVTNAQGEILWIFRRGFWDLPKGKLDEGETIQSCAIREVEEETGVGKLSITQKLQKTYHIFKRNGKYKLKINCK